MQRSATVKRIPVENIAEEFASAAARGDAQAAWRAANRALTNGLSVIEVYEHIVLPSLACLSHDPSAECGAGVISAIEHVLAGLHPHLPQRPSPPPQALVLALARTDAERPLLEMRARALADLLGSDGWRVPPPKTGAANQGDAPDAVVAIASSGIGEQDIRRMLAPLEPKRTRVILICGGEQWPLENMGVLVVPDEHQARAALKEVFAAERGDAGSGRDAALLPGQLSLSFESSDVLLCIIDDEQRVVTANRIARDEFGFSAGEPVAHYLDAGSREMFEALLRGNDGVATQLVEVGFIRHGRPYLAEILLLPCGDNRAMLAYPRQQEAERVTTILNNYNREINKLNGELRDLRSQMRRQASALDSANARLSASYEEIDSCRMEDPLTGAFNKRYYMINLVNEINRARRYQRSLGFLLIDVDDFSQINKTHGYPAGDETLRNIARIISKHTRQGIDWLARTGDEEFVVVLPETDMEGCLRVGEKLRSLVASSPVRFDGREIQVTISVGGASYDAMQDVPLSFQELTTRADQALGRARKQGPNTQRIEPIE